MRKDTRSDLLVLINTLDNIDDLREVKTMVVEKIESLGRQTKYNLVVGEEVNISGSGRIDSGKIIKINDGSIHVDTTAPYGFQVGDFLMFSKNTVGLG